MPSYLIEQCANKLIIRDNADSKSMMVVRVSNGQIQVEESDPKFERSSAIYSSQGVIGIYKMADHFFLASIKQSRETRIYIHKFQIINIEDVEIIPILDYPENPVELKVQKMITELYKSKQFFYCWSYDICSSLQKHSEGPDADNQFIFNHDLYQRYTNTPLMKYTPHLMSGFCEQIKDCCVENHYFNMILISRRSRYHSGTRFNTRGLKNSKCANFVETEQIIQMINENQEATEEYYSVTQIRGSIPVYWQQNVTLKYTPKVTISKDEQQNRNGFLTHIKEITSQYGGITIVNLIDKKKDQLILGKEYERYSEEFKTEYKLHYIWFDFHKECARMKWENLSKLMADIDADIKAYGYFHIKSDGNVDKKQTGVCRTNCMDNLDRTNVVQSLIGRRVVLYIFDSPSSLTLDSVLNSPYSQFEVLFKGVWSDNADRLSYLYSGTNALKTDFTRTGKRTFQGLWDDGCNSMMRYYLNNFCDGCKQDAINLLVGDYTISEDVCKKIAKKQNAFMMFLRDLAVILAIIAFSIAFSFPGPYNKVASALMVFTAILCILYMFLKKGNKIGLRYTDKPILLKETKADLRKED